MVVGEGRPLGCCHPRTRADAEPSPLGHLSWWGWSAEHRANLGGALLSTAAIGAVILLAERELQASRERAELEDREQRLRHAARVADRTLGRYADALQRAWLQSLRVYKEQAVEWGEQLDRDPDDYWNGGLTERTRDPDELWPVKDLVTVQLAAHSFLHAVPFTASPRLADAHLLLNYLLCELLEGSPQHPIGRLPPSPHTDSVRLRPWFPEEEEVWLSTQRVDVSPNLAGTVNLVLADIERAITSLYLASPDEVESLMKLRDRVHVDWSVRNLPAKRYRWARPTLKTIAARAYGYDIAHFDIGRTRKRLMPVGAEEDWWHDRATRFAWVYRLRAVARKYDPDDHEGTVDDAVRELLTALPPLDTNADFGELGIGHEELPEE